MTVLTILTAMDSDDGFNDEDEVFQWWVLLQWWLLACCFGGGCWVLGSGCGCWFSGGFVVQWWQWVVRWWLVFSVAIFFGGDSGEELMVEGGCVGILDREKGRKEERKEN